MIAKEGLYPLSYPQKSIWYLEKMYPFTCMANISATLKFETQLDIEAANEAINHAIKTNESFRLQITEVDGEAFQYVSNYRHRRFDFFDFSDSDISKLYEWDTMMNDEPIYALDEPLYYFAIIKISDNMAGIFTKLHHLIADAWTLVTLGNELIANYFKLLGGKQLDYEMKPSYLEYLESERKYFNSPRFLKDEAYWLEKFNIIPDLTELKNRKLLTTSLESKRMTFKLPDKLCKQIRLHCNSNNTSIFSLYMGAMAVYINRTLGLEKVIFGTPVLNRRSTREKETLGMYISTAPLTVDIDDSKTYEEFTEDINREWLTLLRHQKYPYMMLLKKLREKHPGLEKLYDIVISYQNAKFVKTGSNHFQEGRWHQNKVQTETLYIHINDREADGNIIINYDYLVELFYPKEIEFLHDHVIRLLWHFIDNPQRQIPFIEMISEKGKQKILHDFNQTTKQFDNMLPIHKLFEKAAARFPDKTALVFKDEKMSYRELNTMANKVAKTLMRQGIGPGDIVGFMVSRSFSTIISMLGILKSGAVYMPIDTNYPTDRVMYILENSKASGIIIDKDIFNLLEYNSHVIDINEALDRSGTFANPEVGISPGDSAVIIYTSGSTGFPKGVEISHESLMNFVPAMKELVNFNPSKTFISITSESFDIFFFETLLPLSQGLKVIMTNETERRIPGIIQEIMLKYKVDMIQTTPTRMNYILNNLGNYKGFEQLKDIILGGEVFKETLLKKLQKITNARIYNGYGPSETTIYSTFKELTHTDVINIGRPIANTRIYIVDKHLVLMPIGTVGELCISGKGVMKGYVNNKDLTDKKLVNCPFEPGNIMFRTGDLASWYGKGEIEYVGRNDNQVKINGLRVEYGEIETHILGYPGIKEAVASVIEDSDGKPQVCAYYVADDEINKMDIREKLSEKLPVYMVPSHFIKLNELPLTTSGKISRSELPKPMSDFMSERDYVPPVDKLDRMLCDAYASILKYPDIGINDHFFELGGDSLGVIELVSVLYKKGYSVNIEDVYKNPIIKDLKNCISENRLQIIKSSFVSSDSSIVSNDIYWQIQKGNLDPIDSAAITYIPENSPIWSKLFDEKPVMYKHMALDAGNIGIIAIPIGINSLYGNKTKTIQYVVDAVRMAEDVGAGAISLTGLIPSATEKGRAVEEAVLKTGLKPRVTTGHPTTAATVILSLHRLLSESKRNIKNEDICILGVGSIGSAVIRLMLAKLPHPCSLLLCDLPGRMNVMEELRKELIDDVFSYKGNIKLAYSDGAHIPDEIYKSTLIIGATNVPEILDIRMLKPGTLVVDDSGPHCFSSLDAKKRILADSDILITEGGVLDVPGIIDNHIYLPKKLDNRFVSRYKSHFSSENQITGCILSGLMSATNTKINPSVGDVEISDCICNYSELTRLGYRGASLHFDEFTVPETRIRSFMLKYSKSGIRKRPLLG